MELTGEKNVVILAWKRGAWKMEQVLQVIQTIQSINVGNIPLGKIIIVAVVILLTLMLRKVFIAIVVNRLEGLTQKTETDLDDQLIDILKQPLGWLFLLGGLGVVQLIMAGNLSPQLNEIINKIIEIGIVFIICSIGYRAAPVLGQIVKRLTSKTNTDLDDLFVPYVPKLLRIAAVVVFLIKASNTLLGDAAAALLALLGGAGIAVGLILKDIVYDWFCTIVIFVDGLYKPGDWAFLSGVGFVQVLEIGLRTSKLYNSQWGSIVKMPNSRMITGIVDNWSQNRGDEEEWGIVNDFKIDSISANKSATIIKELKEKIEQIKGLDPKSIIVRFVKIEGNARVFQIMAKNNDGWLYFDAEKDINLAILEVAEAHGIEHLATVSVELPNGIGISEKMRKALNN
ncbi:MAG: mechanosensitive ion channel protein MscS [Hormoscilla sp.]